MDQGERCRLLRGHWLLLNRIHSIQRQIRRYAVVVAMGLLWLGATGGNWGRLRHARRTLSRPYGFMTGTPSWYPGPANAK